MFNRYVVACYAADGQTVDYQTFRTRVGVADYLVQTTTTIRWEGRPLYTFDVQRLSRFPRLQRALDMVMPPWFAVSAFLGGFAGAVIVRAFGG